MSKEYRGYIPPAIKITYGKEASYCQYCGNHFSGAYFCPKCGCEGRDNPDYTKHSK